MSKLLFLEPVFKEKIWGGRNLEKYFNYQLPDGNIGECWAISGHKHGATKIKNGTFAGQTLDLVYRDHKEQLFNNDSSKYFPLLVKLLDAQDDLSVQVHPDDEYAQVHEGEYGKTECWFVIDAESDAKIIHGHHAKNKEEFLERLSKNDYTLWGYKKISKNDFIYVPSKTVHTIGKGTFIYEVQQSSDTTYRIFDFNRRDNNGQLRELHINKAIDVINFPSIAIDEVFEVYNCESNHYSLYHLVKNDYFEVNRVVIQDEFTMLNDSYMLVSILNGQGLILDEEVKKGDHLIIPSNQMGNIVFKGTMEIIIVRR